MAAKLKLDFRSFFSYHIYKPSIPFVYLYFHDRAYDNKVLDIIGFVLNLCVEQVSLSVEQHIEEPPHVAALSSNRNRQLLHIPLVTLLALLLFSTFIYNN